MAPSSTVYLTLPKEKASRIITSEVTVLEPYKKGESTIKLGYTKSGSQKKASEWWMISLYDYEFRQERIETSNVTLENGMLGTRMKYREGDKYTSAAKNSISDYIETS